MIQNEVSVDLVAQVNRHRGKLRDSVLRLAEIEGAISGLTRVVEVLGEEEAVELGLREVAGELMLRSLRTTRIITQQQEAIDGLNG